MNTKSRFAIVFSVVLLAGAALVAVTWAAPESMPLAGGAPAVVAYQGEVQVSGSPYSGDGYFKFAVVNSAGDSAYWSNDGSSTGGNEPTTPVKLAVSEGLFSVLLGNTTLSGMTQALTADVFSQPNRYLRVWFSTSAGGSFSNLTPDTPIAAVPYALQAQEAVNADTVDGMHASQLGVDYHNMVVVAKSGGDYTSVQAAIDSITDAAADNPYLIWVAPGVYEEQVAIKPYIRLQGAGQEATVISSASSSVWPPTQATLVLASDTSLRDLTVVNSGADDTQVALLATAGDSRFESSVQFLQVGGEVLRETFPFTEVVEAIAEELTISTSGWASRMPSSRVSRSWRTQSPSLPSSTTLTGGRLPSPSRSLRTIPSRWSASGRIFRGDRANDRAVSQEQDFASVGWGRLIVTLGEGKWTVLGQHSGSKPENRQREEDRERAFHRQGTPPFSSEKVPS